MNRESFPSAPVPTEGSPERNLDKQVAEISSDIAKDRANRGHLSRLWVLGPVLAAQVAACAPKTQAEAPEALPQAQPTYEMVVEKKEEVRNVRTITLSNGRMIELPDLAGMTRAETALPEGTPDKLIINFAQTHGLTENAIERISIPEREQILSDVLESQTEIYGSMRQLTDRGLMKKVCVEGITSQKNADELVASYRKNLRYYIADQVSDYLPQSDIAVAFTEFEQITGDGHVTLDELDRFKQVDSYLADATQPYRLIVGAPIILALEGRVELCPGDDASALSAAMHDPSVNVAFSAARDKASTPEHQRLLKKVVLEDREDGAMKQLSQQDGDVIGMVYGADHSFDDAVSRWNARGGPTIGVTTYRSSSTRLR